MTDSSYFFDTSAWLSYFYEDSDKIKEIVEDKTIKIFTSFISNLELKRKLKKDKLPKEKQDRVYKFLAARTVWIVIEGDVVAKAAEYDELHTVDSLIYGSAQLTKTTLITRDNDFRGLNNVIVL